MAYNPFTPGYETLVKTAFTAESHGSIETTPLFLSQGNIPDYATMFYHPSDQEVFASFKYRQHGTDYEPSIGMRDSIYDDATIEMTPHPDGAGSHTIPLEEFPGVMEQFTSYLEQEARDEIQSALETVLKKHRAQKP